jgi:hypothetical protein
LGERLLCKQEVIGSIPFTSTSLLSSNESAPCAFPFGFGQIAVSIFNNSEEAKRFNLRLVMSRERVDNGL